MKHAWVVVASSDSAYFYSVLEQNFHFLLRKSLAHPQSKLKEQALNADKPGHYQKGVGIKGAYEPPTAHKDLEMELFAKEICQELENGRAANLYQGLIIIAEPHFYGLIHRNAPPHVQRLIKFHLPKNYTHYSEQELTHKLQESLSHELRIIFIESE